jgi:hypothetical protein
VPVPISLVERGKAFEALGRAMQDHETTLTNLCGLAMDAGLRFEFRFAPGPPSDENTDSGEGPSHG